MFNKQFTICWHCLPLEDRQSKTTTWQYNSLLTSIIREYSDIRMTSVIQTQVCHLQVHLDESQDWHNKVFKTLSPLALRTNTHDTFENCFVTALACQAKVYVSLA